MKATMIMAVSLLAALALPAQQKPVTVTGSMDIRYGSRVTKGTPDVYNMRVNFSDSVVFRGAITNFPVVIDEGMFSDTLKRGASMVYAVECDVVNPKNPAQTRHIGKLFGKVPVASDGTYGFNAGTLTMSTYAAGTAGEYTSKFGGTAKGKALWRPKSWVETAKKEALKLTQSSKGKAASLVVTNYDFMDFRAHKLAGGPVAVYSESVVDGRMLYDRDRAAWYFNGVTITYAQDGVQKIDRLSGSVRWIEQPRKGNAREGEYQFDIRVNEPLVTETSLFGAAATEESFFETDNSLTAMTGTMKYVDAFTGERVTASQVAIDLKGNTSAEPGKQLTRQQGMNLTKLIQFTATVPFNSE